MPVQVKDNSDPRCATCGHPRSEHKVATTKGLACIAHDHFRHVRGVFYCKCNRYEPRAEREKREN